MRRRRFTVQFPKTDRAEREYQIRGWRVLSYVASQDKPVTRYQVMEACFLTYWLSTVTLERLAHSGLLKLSVVPRWNGQNWIHERFYS